MRKHLLGIAVSLIIGILFAGNVSALTITSSVPGTFNLYYDDWGHPYNDTGFPAGTQMNALGTGEAPSAFPFIFSSGQTLNLTATGCVVDSGPNCTGPDGASSLFRDLPVYSLIGIWSSEESYIAPIEPDINPAFFVGSSASLIAPTFAGDLYLFLGENDGNFSDNPDTYAYSVSIDVVTDYVIPEPATLFLVGSGLIGLAGLRRRLKK